MIPSISFDWISRPEGWIALLSLALLEIVLGIDNIIFISILAGKLPTEAEREKARRLGLIVAVVARVLLLLSVGVIISLTAPIFQLPDLFGLTQDQSQISGRDLILIGGGAFLIWKAVKEIHAKLEGAEHHDDSKVKAALSAILIQIFILDVVFSIDSVITAVGMSKEYSIMILAVLIAVGFMLAFSKQISSYVDKHPAIKILALSFLIMIGVSLIAEGGGSEIPKGYIYFSMAFAVGVEMLNMRVKGKPVELKRQTVIKID